MFDFDTKSRSGGNVNQLIENANNLKEKRRLANSTKLKTGNPMVDRLNALTDEVKRKLAHLQDKYTCITDEDTLHKYIDKAIENGYIALDTETTGLDPITDRIVGACIYTPNEVSAYIPINHIGFLGKKRIAKQLTQEQVAKEFQRLVDNNVKIVYFNAKFDKRFCKNQLGVDLPIYWDTAIGARCLKENESENNLKYLWTKYCSENKEAPHFTFDKLFKGYSFDLIPLDCAYLYAANDAIITWELFKYQEPYLTPTHPTCIAEGYVKLAKLFQEIEMPIIDILATIEDNGVALDFDYCKELSAKYTKMLNEVEERFATALEPYKEQIRQFILANPKTKLTEDINISSPSQLSVLFYDVFQLPMVDKKNPRGTGEDILSRLEHPLCEIILEYRGISKLLSTYIDKMPTVANTKTRRVHCNYKQYGADTGRFASDNPNLQNIPSKNHDIRKMFKASDFAIVEGDTEIEVLRQDSILTSNGMVNIPNLVVGDMIFDESHIQHEITEIIDNDDTFLIRFK